MFGQFTKWYIVHRTNLLYGFQLIVIDGTALNQITIELYLYLLNVHENWASFVHWRNSVAICKSNEINGFVFRFSIRSLSVQAWWWQRRSSLTFNLKTTKTKLKKEEKSRIESMSSVFDFFFWWLNYQVRTYARVGVIRTAICTHKQGMHGTNGYSYRKTHFSCYLFIYFKNGASKLQNIKFMCAKKTDHFDTRSSSSIQNWQFLSKIHLHCGKMELNHRTLTKMKYNKITFIRLFVIHSTISFVGWFGLFVCANFSPCDVRPFCFSVIENQNDGIKKSVNGNLTTKCGSLLESDIHICVHRSWFMWHVSQQHKTRQFYLA